MHSGLPGPIFVHSGLPGHSAVYSEVKRVGETQANIHQNYYFLYNLIIQEFIQTKEKILVSVYINPMMTNKLVLKGLDAKFQVTLH